MQLGGGRGSDVHLYPDTAPEALLGGPAGELVVVGAFRGVAKPVTAADGLGIIQVFAP